MERVGVDQGGQGWSESALRGWGSQGWSNFVGERAGSISEGRIRSSKSGRWLGVSDSVWERLRLVRGVRNRSYKCQSYWGWLGDGQIWSWQCNSLSLKVRVS